VIRGDSVNQVRGKGVGGRAVSLVLLGSVLLVALFLRVTAVLQTEVVAPIRSDAAEYYAYAYNLHHFGVYSHTPTFVDPESADVPRPDDIRTPGYPLFLYPFANELPTAKVVTDITLVQALLSTVTVLLAYLLLRYFLPFGWAVAASFLTAVSPHLVNANVYLLTEGLFTLILVTALLALFRAVRSQRVPMFLFAGLLLGLGALVRPGLQYLAFVFAVYLLAVCGGSLRWKAVAALVLGFVIVVAPWHVRNKLSVGEFSSSFVMTGFLHHGIYPDFKYKGDDRTLGFPYRYDPESPKIGASLESVTGEIVRRFRDDPLRHARWYFLGKPISLWSWHIVQGMGDAFVYEVRQSPYFSNRFFQLSHRVSYQAHGPLLFAGLLTLFYIWFGRRRWWAGRDEERRYLRMMTLVLVYFTALHMLGAPFPRYSIPLRPLLYGLAMYGLWRIAGAAIAVVKRRSA